MVKVLLGGLLLTVLVLLIWGPLLVISLVNSTSTPNPPISASVSLAVEGYEVNAIFNHLISAYVLLMLYIYIYIYIYTVKVGA